MTVSHATAASAAPAAGAVASAPPVKPAAGKAPPAAGGQPASANAQQQAALRQLLNRYTYDQAHGTDAATLSALRRQITAAAKTLGQHVTLPQAPAVQATGDAESAAAASPAGSRTLSLLA